MAETLGELIRKNRDLFEMSLADLAKAMNMTKAHVWELEQGRAKNPTIYTIVRLSRALHVPLTDLAEAAARGVR